MKKDFSPSWKSSQQPRKQRKYLYNMPDHKRGSLVSVHLSQDLRKKYSMRNIRVRKGDKVKVISGQFKGKTGKVETVNVKDTKIIMSGLDIAKKDGTKTSYKFHPSNLMIEELDLSDKKRMKRNKTEVKPVVEKKTEKSEVKPKVEEKKAEVKTTPKVEVKETPKVAEKKEIKVEAKPVEKKVEKPVEVKKEAPKAEVKPAIQKEEKVDKK